MSFDVTKTTPHPYVAPPGREKSAEEQELVCKLNRGRDNSRGAHVKAVYYYEVLNDGPPLRGLGEAAQMILEHGTVKPWAKEGSGAFEKPPVYDENMSWLEDVTLYSYNQEQGIEAGTITICYPLAFFDKSPGFPYAQLMMAVASEPFSAFTTYQGAKLVDLVLPEALRDKLPGAGWGNRRVREYLGLKTGEPMIGTIVKPKAGLTPEIFAHSVAEAAIAGASFTKADENMHLRRQEIQPYVSAVVRALEEAGFWLGRGDRGSKRGFLFAPHITAGPEELMDYAALAVEAGANALMFSPYYGGGFALMSEVSNRLDVPVYAHTAGMNVFSGAGNWGIDSSIMYRFAARYGAAFMQLTAIRGYLKPDDAEKDYILGKMAADGLAGANGMTLAIAGGVGPKNVGINAKVLGSEGRMFLAGTSVYAHPDGPGSGVKALVNAYRAFEEAGITEPAALLEYAKNLGSSGIPLAKALEGRV